MEQPRKTERQKVITHCHRRGSRGSKRDDDKDAAAKELGRKGGKKRAANLSPERRAEIAKKAAEKRWSKT
ncbi:hypothetical protein ACG873_23320 [Mesorhizobium sp. AaZ16]|uniref:hypothetical protein n=1 Tax=Mesorhizobium sp. AaZ16 TaxID=3402289 RepID=UPI00374F36F6